VLVLSRGVLERFGVTAADLRANLVVDADVAALASGTVVRFGALRLRITLACETCSRVERVREGLMRELRGSRGVLARVLSDGELRAGMTGTIERRSLPALPEQWQDRVAEVLAQLPERNVVTYARLAEIVGVQASYCRALPAVLAKIGGGLPVERVVRAGLGDVRGELWDGVSYYRSAEA